MESHLITIKALCRVFAHLATHTVLKCFNQRVYLSPREITQWTVRLDKFYVVA